MADTRPDVVLPANTWVDAYASSGINLGSSIDIWNKGSDAVLIAIKLTAPTDNRGVYIPIGPTGHIQVTQGESGVWLKSKLGSSVAIQEM